MSVRFCGRCGSGWGPEFNFCPKDGMSLNVEPIAHVSQQAPAAAPVFVAPAPPPQAAQAPAPRKAPKRARGAWAFGARAHAEPHPARAQPEPKPGPAPSAAVQAPPPEPKAVEIPRSPRSPWGAASSSRAPAEAAPVPKPAPVAAVAPTQEPARIPAANFEVPDFDFGPAGAKPEPEPQKGAPRRIEGPETRGRRRPAREVVAAPEIARAVKEIEVEPARLDAAEVVRGDNQQQDIFTAKKRRDAAAFSETAWFRRPLENAQIDPVSGRVAHTASTYRPDPKVTMTQRRKFSLRRVGEEAV